MDGMSYRWIAIILVLGGFFHLWTSSIFAGYRPKLCPGTGKEKDGMGWWKWGNFLFFSILVLMVLGEKLICGFCSHMCFKVLRLQTPPQKLEGYLVFLWISFWESQISTKWNCTSKKHLDMLNSSSKTTGIFWGPTIWDIPLCGGALSVVELYIGYSFRCAGCTQFKSFCISNCSFCVFAMCWCADGLCMSLLHVYQPYFAIFGTGKTHFMNVTWQESYQENSKGYNCNCSNIQDKTQRSAFIVILRTVS